MTTDMEKISQNVTENAAKKPSRSTGKRELAAQLLADDHLTDEQIALRVGVTRRTLARWKHDEAFSARVEEITAIISERALRHGFARRERRLNLLSDNLYRLRQVIEERSTDATLAIIPGGKTGLLTRMLKGIGKGEDFQVVEVYEVDTPTLREIRATLDQISEELGQKITKLEHIKPAKTVQQLTDEELDALIREEELDFEVVSSSDEKAGEPHV